MSELFVGVPANYNVLPTRGCQKQFHILWNCRCPNDHANLETFPVETTSDSWSVNKTPWLEFMTKQRLPQQAREEIPKKHHNNMSHNNDKPQTMNTKQQRTHTRGTTHSTTNSTTHSTKHNKQTSKQTRTTNTSQLTPTNYHQHQPTPTKQPTNQPNNQPPKQATNPPWPGLILCRADELSTLPAQGPQQRQPWRMVGELRLGFWSWLVDWWLVD